MSHKLRPVSILLLSALAVLAAGCETSSDMMPPDDVPDADLTGTWVVGPGSILAVELPTCTGDLVAQPPGICAGFIVAVSQTGSSFAGAASSPSCPTLTFSGTVTGNGVRATLTYTPIGSMSLHTLTLSGTVNGNTFALATGSVAVDGLIGSCRVSGSYSGLRQ